MWQRKDEQEEVINLQNHFTAYLNKAIQRQKKDYMNKKNRLLKYEVSCAFPEIVASERHTPDLLEQLPVLMHLENMALLKVIEGLTELERGILFARVLEECGYDEIARKLGLQYKGTSAIYYRVIQKLRRELRGDKE